MDWLSDVWSGVRSFLGLGRKDDDERRRREQEEARRRQEAQRQQAQKQQQQAQVRTQPTHSAPQQQPWARSTADTLGLNKKPEAPKSQTPKPEAPKPEAPKPQAISPQDRKLIQGIRGYYVMSPAAQKQALERARSLSVNRSRQQAPKVADPMRDAFHQNPTQPATAPVEQRMAQVQANTLNRQVDYAKEQARVGLQRAKAPSVEEYNKMNPNAQRQYIKTLEAYRDNQDIRTLKGRSEVARINEALGKIQEEGEGKMGNLPTLLTDLVLGMGDYIGDSALRRGAMEYQDMRRQATGKTNSLGLTPDDVKGVNEAYLRGEIGYDDLVRVFRDSPQLYNLDTRYKISKDKGIETIDSELERAGTIGKDVVSGALTALSFAPVGFTSNAASLMGRFASRALQGGTFNVFADLGSQAINEAGYERTPEEVFQDGVMTFVLGGVLEGVAGGRGVSTSDINTVRRSGVERIKKTDPQLTDAEAEEIVETAIKRAEDKRLISRETENADQAVIEKSAKIAERSETTPQPAGTIRLYQGTENNVPSPNYFDNIGQLEDYYRFRSDGVDFNFVDVPTNQAQRVPGAKGEAGVFEIKPDESSLEGIQRMLAQADEARETIPQVQEQAAQQAQGSQRGGISAEEIMERYRERSRIYNEADPATRAEINERAASQVNSDDVSFDSPWSKEAVWSDLVNLLGEQDARTLSNRYNMTAMDWRAVMNATGDVSRARNLAGLFDSQIRKVLKKERVQPIRNKPQRSADVGDSRFIDTPEGRVDTTTGEIVDTPPAGDAPTNPFEARMLEREQYIRGVMEEADVALKESGSSYAELHRKIQEADRTDIDPTLTETEARAYDAISRELDTVLEDMIARGEVSPDVGRRKWYLPQQAKGTVNIPRTAEEFYDTRFGYDQARTGKIELDDLDDSFDPTIDYYVKGTPDAAKSTIYNDVLESNPNILPEAAEQITELKYSRISNTNKIAKEVDADPRKIDTLTDLGKEAELEGIERVVDNSDYRFLDLNARDRLRAIQSDQRGKSLYDSGFDQYRFAHAYTQDVTDASELVELAVARGLNNVPETQLNRIAQRADSWVTRAQQKMISGEIDEATFNSMRHESYAQGLRLMSKANIEQSLKRVEYSNPRVRDMVNYEFNSLNIGYNKAQSLVNEMGKITRRLWNNSMRNLNVNSFLNEMTDVINVLNRFEISRENLANLNPVDMYDVVRRYGVGHSLNRMDNPDMAVEAMGILGSNNSKAIEGLFKAANTIDEKTALYSVAENYKAATYLKAAEDYWSAPPRNLSGTQLRERVLRDFDRDMIPLDHFSRVFSTDNQAVKLLTQYLDWNILHTMQQGRRAIGAESSVAGRQTKMGRGARIADNLATNLAPRVAIGMARGTPIIITLGVLDPLGVASQDYSGIQDKTALDEFMSALGVSPVLGLASQFYLNWRQDEIANENYDGNPPEDNRGDWLERSMAGVGKMFTPFGGQLHRTGGMVDVLSKGYSENKSGRVQYLAPDNPFDIARGLVMGKGQTQPAREYSGTPDLFSVMVGDATLGELLTSNPSFEALQTFLGQENVGDYKRPVSDNDFIAGKDGDANAMTKNFNDLIKNADSRQEQEKILEQARDYNEVLDNFRRENPRAAEAYDQVMSNDDLVSPEYWREIIGTAADGSINLDIFKMIGDRKKQLADSLGIPYDPMYDLPDDQARSLLQLKSTATGDDLALRNILYKTEWYNKYVDDRNAYYDQMPENLTGEGRRETERVKTWNVYNDSLTELSLFRSPETQQKYPYHAAYKAAEAEFEKRNKGKEFYGSAERDAWMAQYKGGYYGEKDSLNSAKLELINQMRVIEGYPPMSAEEYEQATNIADTSGGGGSRRGGGGGGGSGWSRNDFIGRFENNYHASTAPKAKPRNIQFKPKTSAGSRNRATARLGARSAGRDSGGYSI